MYVHQHAHVHAYIHTFPHTHTHTHTHIRYGDDVNPFGDMQAMAEMER